MYGGRRDLEITPYVSLRGRAAVNLGVVIDEGKVLPLLWRVSHLPDSLVTFVPDRSQR